MDDEKRMKDKQNKALYPEENKAVPSGVRIRFKQGRAAEGVSIEPDGTALVDAATADRLVRIGYAELVSE